MPKVKVPVSFPDKDGKINTEMKNGEIVNVVEQKEPWSEYRLEDGTIIKTKHTALQIVKIDDLGPDGNPMYSIQANPNIVVIPG